MNNSTAEDNAVEEKLVLLHLICAEHSLLY